MDDNVMIPDIPGQADLIAQADQQRTELATKHRSGADWFFWIAGLSIVNSLIVLFGANLSFVIGLGSTQLIDGLAMGMIEEGLVVEHANVLKVAAFLMDVFVACSFVLWGILARRRFRWAYIVGMVFYALDGLLFVLVMDLWSIGFHIFALYCLYKGFQACGQLKKLDALTSAMAQ
ncbi:MAG: hypothetical protein EOM12_17800 [Verrucomicrobiae bacterium]|nr:hypothetical protein [Verrucomicrobiae bacterium]